jgi:hypothetical protein
MFKLNTKPKDRSEEIVLLADDYAEIVSLSKDIERRKAALREEILASGLNFLSGMHATVQIIEKTRRTLPTEVVLKNLGETWVEAHKVSQTVRELHVTEK